jgi:hypothetical protein
MKHKIKSLASITILIISGCAGNQATNKDSSGFSALKYLANANNITSEKQPAEYKHFDVYYSSGDAKLSKEAFIESINKCVNHGAKSIIQAGQGYKVLKSFGHSDEKILLDGTRFRMETKGWQLYTFKNSQLERIAHNNTPYTIMSEQEMSINKSSLKGNLEWYQKYAPEVLDN